VKFIHPIPADWRRVWSGGVLLTGCGKRYAEEQRLVSASIRSALKDIDVTSLKGKRAALVFDIVAYEGGGNMSGGRISPGLLLSVGSMVSPVTSASSAFQIFNLAEGGSNYSNTSGGSSSNASIVTGSNTGTSNSTSNGSGTNSGTNAGTNANNSTATSSQSGGEENYNNSAGGYNTNRQTLSPAATGTTTKTEGRSSEKILSLVYKGLGDYQNIAVPKSEACLLMGLVRNYLLFNGVTPTVPTDPKADVLVYVTVDVFGMVRSRFDVLAYNNETVKAETSFEISAFDRDGKMVLRPTVANREAQYREHYLMWTGPF
jgi:hypothetical protein